SRMSGEVAGSGLGHELVLPLLACDGAFAATVVPRENAQAQSTALNTELAAAGPDASSLFGRADLSSLRQSLFPDTPDSRISLDQLAEPEQALRTELASHGVPLSAKQSDYWHGLGTRQYPMGFVAPTPAQSVLAAIQTSLNYRTALTDHAALVQGALPDRASTPAPGRPGFFQVAVSERTAATFHLRVGEALTVAASAAGTPIRLQVT